MCMYMYSTSFILFQGYKNGESIVKKCCYNTTQTTDVRILQIIGENNVTLSPQNPRITEHHKACREEQPKLNFSRYVNNTLCCKVKVFDENNTVAYTEVFECETFSRLNGTGKCRISCCSMYYSIRVYVEKKIIL